MEQWCGRCCRGTPLSRTGRSVPVSRSPERFQSPDPCLGRVPSMDLTPLPVRPPARAPRQRLPPEGRYMLRDEDVPGDTPPVPPTLDPRGVEHREPGVGVDPDRVWTSQNL